MALMPLAHAHDALGDFVSRFHNEMLRRGIKEMTARQWGEEFRSWFSVYEFEDHYEDVCKWLAAEERQSANHP